MKKLLLAFILLLGFHNVLKADSPIERLANLFPENRAKMIENWETRRSVFICKSETGYRIVPQNLPGGFWEALEPLLPEIKELKLFRCNLRTMPITLNCPKLTHLELMHNHLTSIDLSQCPELSYLGLNFNQFEKAPDLKCCPELNILLLEHNRLTQTPDLSANPKLILLDLTANQLESAPHMGEKLEILRISNNKLTQTPDFSKCTKLETAELNKNNLTETPNFSQCPNLETLDLNDNYLNEKPILHPESTAKITHWRQNIFEGA